MNNLEKKEPTSEAMKSLSLLIDENWKEIESHIKTMQNIISTYQKQLITEISRDIRNIDKGNVIWNVDNINDYTVAQNIFRDWYKAMLRIEEKTKEIKTWKETCIIMGHWNLWLEFYLEHDKAIEAFKKVEKEIKKFCNEKEKEWIIIIKDSIDWMFSKNLKIGAFWNYFIMKDSKK